LIWQAVHQFDHLTVSMTGMVRATPVDGVNLIPYTHLLGGVKTFSSLKHNLLQQFSYSLSQLVGLTMPCGLLLTSVRPPRAMAVRPARLPGGDPTRPRVRPRAMVARPQARPPARPLGILAALR
jgi:hypothetical protein